MTYNSAGEVDTQTNPGGIKTYLEYDAAGRLVKQILNCIESSSSSSSSSSSGGRKGQDEEKDEEKVSGTDIGEG